MTGFPFMTHSPVPVYPWWPGEALAARLPSTWNEQIVVWRIPDTSVAGTQGFGLFDATVKTSYFALTFNTLIYTFALFVISTIVVRVKRTTRLARNE